MAQHSSYLTIYPAAGYNAKLDVDARLNKYFKSYQVSAGGTTSAPTFSIYVQGTGDASGINFFLVQSSSGPATISEAGVYGFGY